MFVRGGVGPEQEADQGRKAQLDRQDPVDPGDEGIPGIAGEKGIDRFPDLLVVVVGGYTGS